MANPGYVRSTDGNNADNGSTWALANADLSNAMSDQSAGDRIWVSDNHAESTAASVTITAPGTIASPNQILCGDDSAEPPTALATTGTITTTGTNSMTINGVCYVYGLTFSSGTGGTATSLNLASTDGSVQTYDNCKFTLGNTNSGGRIVMGSGSSGTETMVILTNPVLKFANTGQGIHPRATILRIRGGSIDATGSAISNFIAGTGGTSVDVEVEGFDFTNASSTMNLIASGFLSVGRIIFRNCILPESWSGLLFGGAPAGPYTRAELWNCAAAVASGENNFAMWVEDLFGSAKHETTIVRTGGASDGVTGISWKIATSSDAEYPGNVFRSPEIAVPITSTGAKTLTVHFVSDENVAGGQGAGSGNAFRDDEFWLEARVLGTSDSPKSTITTDMPSVVTTPTDHSASSETWTTTGLTTPQKQQLELAITANEKCTVMVTICAAKASKTVYFCPKVGVS